MAINMHLLILFLNVSDLNTPIRGHRVAEYKKTRPSYKVCPEGIEPCNMKNRDTYRRRYKIQETLYSGQ